MVNYYFILEEIDTIATIIKKTNTTSANSISMKQINVKKNTFISSSSNFNQTNRDKNRRLIDTYMVKYKGFCTNFVKENDELRKLSDFCGIDNIEHFLEEYLFNKATFQYKVEQMFMQNDANKNRKEKLIKDECKKLLENVMIDLQVEFQLKKLNAKFENHIENIKKVEFIENY